MNMKLRIDNGLVGSANKTILIELSGSMAMIAELIALMNEYASQKEYNIY